MSKYSNYNLMRLSDGDDEDGFDPIDFDWDEIDDEIGDELQRFIDKYKAFYDDVKTDFNVYKEDW